MTEPFDRGISAIARTAAGFGIGLPTTRAPVDAQSGRLKIDSELGRGTTIRLLFPTTRARRAA